MRIRHRHAYIKLWAQMLRCCWRHAPGMTALTLACHLLNTFAFAGVGLALRVLVDGAVQGNVTAIVWGAVGAATTFALDWVVSEISLMLTIHLADRVGLTEVEPEIMRLCTETKRTEHLERAEFLDRVTTVRGEGWAIVESSWSALSSVLFTVRVLLTVLLLGGVNSVLMLLLVYAVFQLWLEGRGRRRIVLAEIQAAEDVRLQRHLFSLCITPSSLKEVRVNEAGEELLQLQRAAWDRVTDRRARALGLAALWSCAGHGLYSVGFTLAMAVVLSGNSTPGDIILAVTVGAQLRGAVELTVRRSSETAMSSRVIEPFLWLRGHAEEETARDSGERAAPPRRLNGGITLDGLTFTYPGTNEPAVHDVRVHLPAGSVIAVVGEYGSGKTTLVKLLAKFYTPDSGRILVDRNDLSDIDTVRWRSAMSAAFQDFGRYHTTFGQAVRLGGGANRFQDIRPAVAEADAESLVDQLPDGIDTELGKRFGGVELSEGQWQKVALARACVRTSPLLFVLDEPTASLDAPSEQEIFEHYMRRARKNAKANGAITVVVSHRFSTVSRADLILVMNKGRLHEFGSHHELLKQNKVYADLYRIQERSYES